MDVAKLIKKNRPFANKAIRINGQTKVGYGTSIESRSWSEEEADSLLRKDIKVLSHNIKSFGYEGLDPVRFAVLVDIAHDIGLFGLRRERRMLDAIDIKDFEAAAAFMLESDDIRSIDPLRARRNAEMMRSGIDLTK